jgi:hypothetical protein
MIFVRDKGRMCNNILQYGHLYAWGRENHRATMSMRFAYKYPYFNICHTPYHNFPTYLFAKYASKWHLVPIVSFHQQSEETSEKEDLLKQNKLVVAEGWYARFPSLFLKYKEEIKSLFRFLPNIENKVNKELSVFDTDSIKLGVHIRRGDYATWNGGKFFYTDEQYISVIKQFISLHTNKDTNIFVCGNDPKMNKDIFIKEIGKDKMHFANGNPGEDLCLLSKCDYLIGAPSTFTLVASMYNDTPLYWMMTADNQLAESSFQRFDNLFCNIL